MKNFFLLIFLAALYAFPVFAQKIHSPQEIVDILEKSPVDYELHMLEEEMPAPDRSENVVLHNYYRVERDGELLTFSYEISPEGASYLEAAEKFFGEKNYAEARALYEKVLESDPGFHKARTYIGQTWGIEGDFKKAIKWYEGAIELNYIDYMAHWFLADALLKAKKIDKAVDEITIAYILNRNNPRIRASLDKIYGEKGLSREDWHFNPQVDMEPTSDTSVAIYFHPDWLGYALVKALWRFEPGYRQSMGFDKDEFFSLLEEREALAAQMSATDEEKIKSYPELEALRDAATLDLVEEFILFEILLPQYPQVANQFPEEMIGSIADYVLRVRGKR